MIPIKNYISLMILPLVMFSFSQCSSQKKLQEKSPVKLGEVFCRNWAAGAIGAGAGTNIYISVEEVNEKSIQLDSVYFRGKSAKLVVIPKYESIYVGRFISETNKPTDLIMSSDIKEEYGNKLPVVAEKMPFELKYNECVVSYQEGSKTKYFKIDGVAEKTSEDLPMVPRQ